MQNKTPHELALTAKRIPMSDHGSRAFRFPNGSKLHFEQSGYGPSDDYDLLMGFLVRNPRYLSMFQEGADPQTLIARG